MNHVQADIFEKLPGKRVRTLRFDVNAFADAEPLVGGSVLMILGNPAQLVRFGVLRAMLWAGLKHEDSALTLESVGELMQKHLESGGNITDFMRLVNDGVQASGLVKEAKEEAADQSPPANA